MVSHLFTTPVAHLNITPAAADAEGMLAYLHELRSRSPGEKRSNQGGWHSPSDLFDPARHPQFPSIVEAVTKGLLEYFGAVMGFEGELQFALSAWAVLNPRGATNAPHTHPGNMLSGAYYLRIPEAMTGGEIVFMDARANVNAYGSERKDRLGLRAPWDHATVAHAPKQGDLLIFPSWLPHYVNAFDSPEPNAERVVISFNAAV
jgi:uncharacterized protein (TIGR02466 family)